MRKTSVKTKFICTIFTDLHIAGALVLWESVKRLGPRWKFMAFRVSDVQFPEAVPNEFIRACVDPTTLPYVHPGMRYWYTPFELCCALRGALHKYMLEETDADEWWYIDSDCEFVASPDLLSEEFGASDIVLSLHADRPEKKMPQRDLLWMTYGLFNGGVLGARRSDITHRAADWFCERLTWYSFSEPSLGLVGDQKWLELLAVYFRANISPNLKINVGYWNAKRFNSDGKANEGEVWGAEPVIMHYSMVKSKGDDLVLDEMSSGGEDLPLWFKKIGINYFRKIDNWRSVIGCKRIKDSPHNCNGLVHPFMRRAFYCDVVSGNYDPTKKPEWAKYKNLDAGQIRVKFARSISLWSELNLKHAAPPPPSIWDLRSNYGDHSILKLYSEKELFLGILRKLSGRFIK